MKPLPIPNELNTEIIEKAECAKRISVATRTLDEWMRKGRIPYLKIGRTVRFRWADVLDHLSKYRVG